MKQLLFVVAVFLSGCSLEPWSDFSRVRVELRDSRALEPLGWVRALAGAPDRALREAFLTPQYYCVGLNVMGQGIPRNFRFGNGAPPIEQIIAGQTSCSYEGAFSGWRYVEIGTSSVELEVNVPTGFDRVVQVAGVGESPGVDCSTVPTDPIGGLQVFELGRTITGIFGETTVNVNAHANPSTRRMNCASQSLASIPGKILWLDAAWPCNSIADGAVSSPTWISVPPTTLSVSHAGFATCNTFNGRRFIKFQAASDFYSTSIPAENPQTSNRSGLTLFLVNRFNSTGGAQATALELFATPSVFKIYQVDVSGTQDTFSDANLGVVASISDSSVNRPLNTLRVIGTRASPGELKLEVKTQGGAVFTDQSSPAFTVFNDGSVDTIVKVGAVGANQAMDVFEAIGFDRPLTDAEFQTVMEELSGKYGI